MATPGRRARGAVALLAVAIIAVVAIWLLFLRDAEHPSATQAPVTVAPPAPATLPAFSAPDPALIAEVDAPQPLAETSEAAASATPAADGATSLRVRVTWAADKTPAADIGLQVFFWREPAGGYRNLRRVTTDARGEWFASPVPTGTVGVYTDRDQTAGTKIEPGQAALIEIALPPGVSVRGVVQDAQGAPVAGADVWLSMPQNESEGQVVTRSDAQGRFALRDLPAKGRQVLAARSPSHAPSPLVLVVGDAGETRDIVLVLGGECGAVHGVVLDPGGQPVPDARVTIGEDYGINLDGQSRTPSFDLRCDAQGAFLAEGLPAGIHPIAAAAPGWSPTDRAIGLVKGALVPMTGVLVEAGQTADVTLRLQPSASLSGTARDDAGQPVYWAAVEVRAPLDLMQAQANTGADGSYEIRDLPIGTLDVWAQHPDAGRVQTRLKIEAGQSLTWDPRLTLGSRLAGTLLDSRGAPVASTSLKTRPTDGGQTPRGGDTTDAQGRFEIRGLGPVPQDIFASVPGAKGTVTVGQAVAVDQVDLVLRLPEGSALPAAVLGRVVDPFGAPASGFEVWIADVVAQSSWPAELEGGSGRFHLEGLAPGHYVASVQADPAPSIRSAPLAVAGGQTGDFGDLVLAPGGRVSLLLAAPGPIDELRTSPLCLSETGNSGAKLRRDGERWISSRLAAGRYLLVVQSLDFAAVRKPVVVEDGRDTLIEVSLQAGVQQPLRVLGALAPSQDTPFALSIRAAGGDIVLSFPGIKLHAPTQPPPPDKPAFEASFCLAPGAYRVDVSLGSKSKKDVAFSTSPGSPWEIDLR